MKRLASCGKPCRSTRVYSVAVFDAVSVRQSVFIFCKTCGVVDARRRVLVALVHIHFYAHAHPTMELIHSAAGSFHAYNTNTIATLEIAR